jgi:hypothetical protein
VSASDGLKVVLAMAFGLPPTHDKEATLMSTEKRKDERRGKPIPDENAKEPGEVDRRQL